MSYKKFQSFKILVLLFVVYSSTMLSAYDSKTIYPQNDSISQDLDLDAVASIFGLSSSLEDFEYRLNDPDSQISNLDLNDDGFVDYLRVVESAEDDVRLIVIQAALDQDTYQDVATIVVRRDSYQQTSVEIVGDPHIYGSDYIVEPTYSYTPIIYSYFWSSGYYRTYHSIYRWGYYPARYRRWRRRSITHYHNHIYHHIDRRNHYRYRGRYHHRTKAHMGPYRTHGRKNSSGHHRPELYKRDTHRVSRRDVGRTHKSTYSRSSRQSTTKKSYNANRTHRSTYGRSSRQSTTKKNHNIKIYRPKVSTHKTTKRHYSNSGHRASRNYSNSGHRTTRRSSNGSRKTTRHSNSNRSNVRSRRKSTHQGNSRHRGRTKARAYRQTK